MSDMRGLPHRRWSNAQAFEAAPYGAAVVRLGRSPRTDWQGESWKAVKTLEAMLGWCLVASVVKINPGPLELEPLGHERPLDGGVSASAVELAAPAVRPGPFAQLAGGRPCVWARGER